MLTAAAVANLLGLKPRTVYDLAARGDLTAYRFGGAVRFDPVDVEAYRKSLLPPPPVAWTPRQLKAIARLEQAVAEPWPDDMPAWPDPAPRKSAPTKKAKPKKKSRALIAHHAGKRRAAKLLRTAPWADLGAIRAIYEEARRLTIATGRPHHVDHIVPLQGRLVSGLHVETNLQILTGAQNVRKHNRFEPC